MVKFKNDFTLPKNYEDHLERELEKAGYPQWKKITESAPDAAFFRLFQAVTPAQIQELVTRAKEKDHQYKDPQFLRNFLLVLPPDAPVENVRRDLLAWEAAIERAYLSPVAQDPADRTGANAPGFNFQGYLRPAPVGIDAHFAWKQPGGDGALQAFIDIEQGWFLEHKDLCDAATSKIPRVTKISGDIFPNSIIHGTNTLGVVCATDNAFGCIGIAFNTPSVRVISYYTTPPAGTPPSKNDFNIPAAVLLAAESFKDPGSKNVPGGIVLIEAEIEVSITSVITNVPAEANPLTFEAIDVVTRNGHLVIAAAGNSSLKLDDYEDHFSTPSAGFVFDRTKKGFRDSKAIIVGAGALASFAPVTWKRRLTSNFGNRVDCFAWGDSVQTLTLDPDPKNPDGNDSSYDSTSSASAIIAGAALSLQGMAQSGSLGRRLKPAELVTLLTDKACGTHTNAFTEANEYIGVMPNLACSFGKIPGTPVSHDEPRRPYVMKLPPWIFEPPILPPPRILVPPRPWPPGPGPTPPGPVA